MHINKAVKILHRLKKQGKIMPRIGGPILVHIHVAAEKKFSPAVYIMSNAHRMNPVLLPVIERSLFCLFTRFIY